jgi:hypothetical protein
MGYRDHIPHAYTVDDLLESAYRKGWDHGHGLACHNVPRLGQTYWTESDGRITADRDNIRDLHATLCHEAESNSRQFSPFEFTACELNANDEGVSEELWNVFEEGIAAAIAADLATYDDDDYGIEPEEEEDDED